MCELTNRLNIFHNLRCASQIQQLEKEICGFFQYQVPTHTLLDVTNLIPGLKIFHHLYELGSGMNTRCMKRSSNVSKLTNDPHYNAMILQQMGADDMFGRAFDEALCN